MDKISELLKNYCGAVTVDSIVSDQYIKLQLGIVDMDLWFGVLNRILQIPNLNVYRQYYLDGGSVKWNWTILIITSSQEVINTVGDTLSMILAGHTIKTEKLVKKPIQSKRGMSIEEGFDIPHVRYDINKPDLKTGKGAYRVSPDRDGKEVKKLIRVYQNAGRDAED